MNKNTNANAASPTWEQLITLEPRLADVLQDVLATRRLRGRNKKVRLEEWPEFKHRLGRLIGFQRPDNGEPILKSVVAYNVAHSTLFDALYR